MARIPHFPADARFRSNSTHKCFSFSATCFSTPVASRLGMTALESIEDSPVPPLSRACLRPNRYTRSRADRYSLLRRALLSSLFQLAEAVWCNPPGVVILRVFLMFYIVRKGVLGAVRIGGHFVKRKRFHGFRISSVVVTIFDPAIAIQQKIASPSAP